MNQPAEDTAPEESEADKDDDEPEIATPPDPPPGTQVHIAAFPEKRPRGRPPKNPASGVGAAPDAGMKAPFTAVNAIQLVDEVFDRLRRYPQLGDPENLRIQVWNMERGAEQMLPGSGFDATVLIPQDDRTAGQLLWDYLVDNFHMTRSTAPAGPCLYKIVIQWKKSGKIFCAGRTQLPSVEEIRSMRRAEQMRKEAASQYSVSPYAMPPRYPGIGAMPPPPVPSPASPAPAAAAPAGPQYDPYLWDRLARLEGLLTDTVEMVRSGRVPYGAQAPSQPASPPSPAAAAAPAPPPAPSQTQPAGGVGLEQTVRRIVAEGLGEFAKELTAKLGLGASYGAPTSALETKMRTNVEGIVERVLEKGFAQIGKAFEDGMKAGFGAPPTEEIDEPTIPEPPPDPKDDLPFTLTPTGLTWPDGNPIQYSENKETGEFDIKGAGFGNPFLVKSALDLGNKLADVAKTMAERWASPTKPHVVGEIPRGARPADPGKDDWRAP